MKQKKSDDYYVDIPQGMTAEQVQPIVERAAQASGLYISHIGSYSRIRYPNSVHWHFKRHAREVGLLDATFWDVRSLFWLMIRHREPQWVKDTVPVFLDKLRQEFHAATNHCPGV